MPVDTNEAAGGPFTLQAFDRRGNASNTLNDTFTITSDSDSAGGAVLQTGPAPPMLQGGDVTQRGPTTAGPFTGTSGE